MFPRRDYNLQSDFSLPKLKEDKSNLSAFYKPDTFGTEQPCFKNYGGWPRNELAIINETESIEVAKALADKLVSLPDDTKVNVPDSQLSLMLKSKYCQTPSEQVAHYERVIEARDTMLANRRAAAAARAAAAKEKAELQEIKDSLTPEEREEIRVAKRKKQTSKLV